MFAVFGLEFFKLWVPGEDAILIQILSILAILSLIASACINSVFSVFTCANKVKVPAVVTLITGVLTTLTVFITDLGVYAIAGVSSIFTLLRNYIFTPIYGAMCLKIKKRTFYKEIISGNVCLVINLAVGFAMRQFLPADTWLSLIFSCIMVGIVLVAINVFIVLKKDERVTLIKKVIKR